MRLRQICCDFAKLMQTFSISFSCDFLLHLDSTGTDFMSQWIHLTSRTVLIMAWHHKSDKSIIWANDGLIYKCIYASHSLDDWIGLDCVGLSTWLWWFNSLWLGAQISFKIMQWKLQPRGQWVNYGKLDSITSNWSMKTYGTTHN